MSSKEASLRRIRDLAQRIEEGLGNVAALRDECAQSAIEAREAGASVSEIARANGTSRQSVYALLAREGS